MLVEWHPMVAACVEGSLRMKGLKHALFEPSDQPA